MKLRKFLEKCAYACTDDEVLAERITQDMLLKYDFEVKNKKSCFKMHKNDFENPLDRMEFAFAWKNLDKVDSRKAQRMQDIVFLLSLHSYKNKYQTEDFDKQIRSLEVAIEAQPVPEVEAVAKDVDLVAAIGDSTKGSWSD